MTATKFLNPSELMVTTPEEGEQMREFAMKINAEKYKTKEDVLKAFSVIVVAFHDRCRALTECEEIILAKTGLKALDESVEDAKILH